MMVELNFFVIELNQSLLQMIDDQSSLILKRLQCIKNFKTDQKRSGDFNQKEFSNDKCFVIWS